MKMGKVYVLGVCLAWAGFVQAQTLWSSLDPQPTSATTVIINNNNVYELDVDGAADILRLANQTTGESGTLNIVSNKTLTVARFIQLGTQSGAGLVNQSNGTVSAQQFSINHNSAGDLSRYSLSGGSATATTSVTVNNQGLLEIGGGSFTTPALTVNSGGSATLTGGTLNMNGTLTANGTVTIDGGTITRNIAGVTTTIAGTGAIKMLSGSYALTGGGASDVVQINTALFEISGGAVNLSGQVRLGAGAEMKIIGNDATIQFLRLNNQEANGSTGTFRFVFDEDGVSTVNSTGFINLSASTIIVDGSAFTGEAGTFDLFKGTQLSALALTDNISVSGFGSYGGAYVTQDAVSGLVQLTVIPEPATVGLFIVASVGLMILRRLR